VLPAGKHLAKTGFVKGDNILSGTNFIFSTNKKGYFTAEGIFLCHALPEALYIPHHVVLYGCETFSPVYFAVQ